LPDDFNHFWQFDYDKMLWVGVVMALLISAVLVAFIAISLDERLIRGHGFNWLKPTETSKSNYYSSGLKNKLLLTGLAVLGAYFGTYNLAIIIETMTIGEFITRLSNGSTHGLEFNIVIFFSVILAAYPGIASKALETLPFLRFASVLGFFIALVTAFTFSYLIVGFNSL